MLVLLLIKQDLKLKVSDSIWKMNHRLIILQNMLQRLNNSILKREELDHLELVVSLLGSLMESLSFSRQSLQVHIMNGKLMLLDVMLRLFVNF